MILGFSNGDFWKLHEFELERFEHKYLKFLLNQGTNAVELNCRNLESLNFLLENDIKILDEFDFVSMHAPDIFYKDDAISHKILNSIEKTCKKHPIQNVVFHVDKITNWDLIAKYNQIPISIENMDDTKVFGQTLEDMKSILDRYNFNITIDLQHCFTNDPTMNLAVELQNSFANRIAEYHLSGFKEKVLHYPLFKTNQDIIIKNLLHTDKPIIIESVFDKFSEGKSEVDYLKEKLH